jgi:hypothetical protein
MDLVAPLCYAVVIYVDARAREYTHSWQACHPHYPLLPIFRFAKPHFGKYSIGLACFGLLSNEHELLANMDFRRTLTSGEHEFLVEHRLLAHIGFW